jgi:hypothetical protein
MGHGSRARSHPTLKACFPRDFFFSLPSHWSITGSPLAFSKLPQVCTAIVPTVVVLTYALSILLELYSIPVLL